MILGNVCTRSCKFCAVQKGMPVAVDTEEPERIVKAVREMSLKYVVITSVTRDDLRDGGAGQFVEVVRKLRNEFNSGIGIELLIPDLGGNWRVLKSIVQEDITVLNHNLETVKRLYPVVRPKADYKRSLELLTRAKKENPDILTKSGLMLGLGETYNEVINAMQDLRKVSCDFLTLGQYLQPGCGYLEVAEFVSPGKFEKYREKALEKGFRGIASGPFVRSSYNAEELMREK